MAFATLEPTGFGEFVAQLDALGEKARPAAEAAVKAGAGVVADEVRKSLKDALSGNSTGDLENSLGITPVGDYRGIINARVGFDGYDRNGTPNPLKANVLESGNSTNSQAKTRFFTNAVKSSKNKAPVAMAAAFDEVLQK